MKRIAIGLIAAGFLAVSSAALAVDGGSGGAATSAHNATNVKGTCAKCHIPHGGKGDKIWAQTITSVTSFAGVHQLCNSCHYTGNTFGATSGITAPSDNVFVLNRYWNHSMLQWANTSTVTMPAGFPLNASDTDTLWTGVTDPDAGGGTSVGFYCGTCHNPHKQPLLPTAITNGHGDYLRADASITTLAAFGSSGARDGACKQCHTAVLTAGNASGHNGACMLCHSPHKGQTLASTDAALAEKILVIPLTGNTFTATPNVPGMAAGYTLTIAAVCHGCHKNVANALITTVNEHHPMGTGAALTSPSHAPGWQTGAAGTFGCTICHEVHNATQDFYLRPSTGTYSGVDTDDGAYCTGVCHNNKSVAALGTLDAASNGHAWSKGSAWTTPSANRGTCFMCHFIHDGGSPTGRGAVARADINALMRIAPVNFAAAVTNQDTDVNDYEDMCYGCHSVGGATGITGGSGTAGATLQENGVTAFTHKFTQAPSAAVLTNMGANYPVANTSMTGSVSGSADGYGTVTGELYCGTCHNVHVQNTTGDAQGQMFRRTNTSASVQAGMCVDCHGAAGMSSGRSHPTYLDAGYNTNIPNARTTTPIPVGFGSGGDGVAGGRTSNSTPGQTTNPTGTMSCETCHNFHTASTSRLGWTAEAGAPASGNKGKLLIMDNMVAGAGSEMCQSCHGGGY